MILHMFDIKGEVGFGEKTDGVNCRRLMKIYEQMINRIRLKFIDMNKGIVSDDNIIIVININNCPIVFSMRF